MQVQGSEIVDFRNSTSVSCFQEVRISGKRYVKAQEQRSWSSGMEESKAQENEITEFRIRNFEVQELRLRVQEKNSPKLRNMSFGVQENEF